MQGFILSRRLLYATVFGILIILASLYTTITKKSEGGRSQTQTQKISPKTSTQVLDTTVNTNNKSVPTNSNNKTLTKTDVITRDLLGSYVQQVRNKTYTEQSGEKIVNKVTDEVFALNYKPKQLSTLITTPNNDYNTIKKYKDSLYKTLSALSNLKEYELTIYARAIQNNSKKDFDDLRNISLIYSNVATDMLDITVPKEVSTIHLSILNSLYKFSEVLKNMADGYNDPAAGLSGIGNFTKTEEEIQQSFSKLKTYFIEKKLYSTTT